MPFESAGIASLGSQTPVTCVTQRGHIRSNTRVLLTRQTLTKKKKLGAIQRSCYSHEYDEDTATSTKHYFFQQDLKKKNQTHISITLELPFFHVEKPFDAPQCLGWKDCMRKLVLLQPAWYSFQTRLCSLLKSIAVFHGFNQGLDLAYFYESLSLSRLSDWKSHTFDAAFINRKLD